MDAFSDLSWLAVVAAFVANMVLGMIWYSPKCFGARWMELTGMTMEKAQQGMKQGFAIGMLANLIGVVFIGTLVALIGPVSYGEALWLAGLLFLGVALPIQMNEVAWEQRPSQLMWINVGWTAVSILVTVTIVFHMS